MQPKETEWFKFINTLNKNYEAKNIFESLQLSLQLEIVRYISSLKSEKNVEKNVSNTITLHKIVQRNDVIFYLDNEKNRCIVLAKELFFEEV